MISNRIWRSKVESDASIIRCRGKRAALSTGYNPARQPR